MKVTMLGHSTLLIEMGGKTILTDPWLTDPLYMGQLRHTGDFAPPLSLPPVDALLVSHVHKDHFDPATVAQYPKDLPLIVFPSHAPVAKKAGFTQVISLKTGDTTSLDGLTFTSLPGKHGGGIATYVIAAEGHQLFFGGDSDYCLELEVALRAMQPEVCLMPISGGGLGWIKFHMGPDQAALLTKAAAARTVIPIHYHFRMKYHWLTRMLMQDNCLQRFQRTMAEKSPETEVVALDYGATWTAPQA